MGRKWTPTNEDWLLNVYPRLPIKVLYTAVRQVLPQLDI